MGFFSRAQGDMKQVILVRQDLRLQKGKLAAQVGHAAVEAAFRADKAVFLAWREQGQKKVVLKVANLAELRKYHGMAQQAGIAACIITDAGHTHIAPGTVTVCGIGPDAEEKIDEITGELKMQ